MAAIEVHSVPASILQTCDLLPQAAAATAMDGGGHCDTA
jgi:hypothetical protein